MTPRLGDRTVVRTLAALVFVCQEWREIMHNTPSLWAYICSDHPHNANIECLARSYPASLRISVNHLHLDNTSRQWFKKIFREVHRWKSVEISYVPIELLKEPTQQSIPLLESLGVWDMWEPAEETANPCYESASRLRHLTIVNIAFPWESALLSHLRTLNIDLSEGDSPSAQQVMRILQSCPDLTTLKLHLPQGLHPSPVSLEAFTIELSRLQQLSLKVHPLMTGYLLRHMRIPLCKTFDVDQFGTTGPIFFASMDHLIPSLSSILLAASALSIRVAYNTLEYIAFGKIDEDEEEDAKCGELAQAIRIRASGEQFNESTSLEALSWLLDNVHPSSFSLPVLLEIFRQPTSPHVLTLLMDRFSPVITRLAFDQTAETIISYLAEPSKAIVDGTITLKWPLPNLTHLYIDYDTGLEPGVVLACVQRRAGRGLSSKGKRGCREELPATLIKLSLPCRTSTAEVM